MCIGIFRAVYTTTAVSLSLSQMVQECWDVIRMSLFMTRVGLVVNGTLHLWAPCHLSRLFVIGSEYCSSVVLVAVTWEQFHVVASSGVLVVCNSTQYLHEVSLCAILRNILSWGVLVCSSTQYPHEVSLCAILRGILVRCPCRGQFCAIASHEVSLCAVLRSILLRCPCVQLYAVSSWGVLVCNSTQYPREVSLCAILRSILVRCSCVHLFLCGILVMSPFYFNCGRIWGTVHYAMTASFEVLTHHQHCVTSVIETASSVTWQMLPCWRGLLE
jgi:hypothetical protein